MSTFIEIRSPELIEAINNLARAYTNAAEAVNRLAGAYNPENTAVYDSESAGARQPDTVFLSGYQAPVQSRLSAGYPVKPASPAYTYPSAPPSGKDSLKPARPESAPPPSKALPESGPTLDDLARAASVLMGSGKYALLLELLGKFGVQALYQLPKEHFGAFAAALKQLGAFI